MNQNDRPPIDAPPAAAEYKWLGHSRTVWLNAALVALAFLEENTGLLQPLLPVDFYAALAVLIPLANIVLRVLTSQPVRLTRQPAGTAGSKQE